MDTRTDTHNTLIPNRLLLLRHFEAEAAARGLQANCYVWLGGGGAILVDAVFADTLPLVSALHDRGIQISALVITHRHVVGQAEVLPQIAARFGTPIFLHPIDAAHPQARRFRGLFLEDPMKSVLLRDAGLTVLHFPGHTEGHIMLYAPETKTLLSGDCAMGSPATLETAGLVRPPYFFNVDDERLRREWESFNQSVDSFMPYHGRPVTERQAIEVGLRTLRSPKPTTELPAAVGR